jgi:hypothetical protein
VLLARERVVAGDHLGFDEQLEQAVEPAGERCAWSEGATTRATWRPC